MGEQKEQPVQMTGGSSSWVFYQQLEHRRGHVDDAGEGNLERQAENSCVSDFVHYAGMFQGLRP